MDGVSGNIRGPYNPESVYEVSENSSKPAKSVADFANAYLWYWYHFEEDRELEQPLFFNKFMEDDRTIPVFPEEKYVELKKRLDTETFYYTKTSIRWNAMLNIPYQYRNEMKDEVKKYVESLSKDKSLRLEQVPNHNRYVLIQEASAELKPLE